MQASEIMTPDVVVVRRDTTLEAAIRLLLVHRISGLPVVEHGRVVGIVTEGDLLHRPETGTERQRRHGLCLLTTSETEAAEYVRTHGLTVGEVMTPKVVSVAETTPIEEIAEMLESHSIKRVPVLRGSKLVGIVSRADLIRCLGSKLRLRRRESDVRIRMALLEEFGRNATWAPLPAEVSVLVQDGVVHYWGCAPSNAQRDAMIVAAERIAGVSHVEDHMINRTISDPFQRPNWPEPGKV